MNCLIRVYYFIYFVDGDRPARRKLQAEYKDNFSLSQFLSVCSDCDLYGMSLKLMDI